MNYEELIYDWNTVSGREIPEGRRVMLDDETLRDGLQNPSVHDPSIKEKIEILHLMEALGIDSVNIGLPGAGPRAPASKAPNRPPSTRAKGRRPTWG
jgi:2-isopropylmalate synthase